MKFLKKRKKVLSIIGNLAILLLLVYFLEGWGILGFIIFLSGMMIFRLWKGREQLLVQQRALETVVFGKPLDKDLWKKGEMKNLKLKPTWGKKDDMEKEKS